MATLVGWNCSEEFLYKEYTTKRRFCLLVDVLLYPITSIIYAVVFLLLMLIKFIFLGIKFLIMKCVASCTSREAPSLKGHFKCLLPEDSLDRIAFLLMIPIVGTIAHGYIAQRIMKEKRHDIPSFMVFMMIAPIEHIRATADTWS